MIFKTLVAGLVATALSAAHAFAVVSITNRDDKDHKLTIVEGETRTEHVLKPTQVLEGICAKGCVIRLNDSENDEYERPWPNGKRVGRWRASYQRYPSSTPSP